MNYQELKNAIIEVIRTNGNEEITGEVLQFTLLEMVSSLGKDYQFAGVATPQTAITERDDKVAWVLGAGTYENFGIPFTVGVDEIAFVLYNGSYTVQKLKVGVVVDDTLTRDGQNPVKGGAIYEEFEKLRAAGYIFAGVTTPAGTPPQNLTEKIFYLCKEGGTYTNFGNLVLQNGLSVLKWNGSLWSVDLIFGITDSVTENLASLLTSAGAYLAISAEATLREQGDSTLRQDIADEVHARQQQGSTLQHNIDNEVLRAQGVEQQNASDIDALEALVPSQASEQNKLVDEQKMNSSIGTATATYRGAYNLVSDLSLTVEATHADIEAALALKMSELSITPDNNDYAFVKVPTSDETPTQIERVERYKFNGTVWLFEYQLNNSGFTAEQWAALNSGITSGLVTKLSDLPTYTELMTLFGGKQDVISDLQTIRSGAAKGETAYQKPVGGIPETDFTAALQQALASFITKSVNDLLNYYLKSETYTKTEVNTLLNAIKQFTYVLVQTLPTASADTMNKIYLVPSSDPQTQNVKDEYITIATENGGTTTYAWEQIGSTAIDLSGYYTSTQTDSAISSALSSALASYSTTSQMNSAIALALANYYTKSEIDAALALKASQSELTALTGRVTFNENDIAALQGAYEALTQGDIVAVAATDTWPVANPEENVIYRVADRTHTPPQYYTDYMWNGSSFVVLAENYGDIDDLVEKVEEIEEALLEEVHYTGTNVTDEEIISTAGAAGVNFNRYNNPVGLTLKGVKVKVYDPHGLLSVQAYLYYAHEDGDNIVYDGYVSLGDATNGVNSYTLQTPITLQPKSLLAVGLLNGTTDANNVSYSRSSTSSITWMAAFPGKTTNLALQAMAVGTTAPLPTGSSVIQGYVALQLNAVTEEIVVLHSDDVVELIRGEFETGVVCKNYLYGKTLVSHGDSEVAGQDTYPNLIAARNKMPLYNYGVGGRSLVVSLQDMKQCPEGANYITIQIGWNDLYYWDPSVSDDSTDVTTFKGAFNNLVGYYQENFPAAHLVIILPLYINDESRYGISMWEKERCATLNIACIDINPYCGMRRAVPALSDMYWMDNVHLKAAGHLRVSYMYEAKLREM